MSFRHACRSFDMSDNIIGLEKVLLGNGWRDCLDNIAQLYRIPGNEIDSSEILQDADLFLEGNLAMRLGPAIPALHSKMLEATLFRWGMTAYPNMPSFGTPISDQVIIIPRSDTAGDALRVVEAALSVDIQLKAMRSDNDLNSSTIQAALGLADRNTIIREREELLWLQELRRAEQ